MLPIHRKIIEIPSRIKQRAQLEAYRMKGKHLVHFLHMGKTGGSAIKNAFRQYPVSSPYAINLCRHSVKLHDIPQGESVIFTVRDPISRFVSAFYFRQRKGQRNSSPWTSGERKAFEYFSTPNQLAVAITSSNMEERDRARLAMAQIGFVRSSYWYWFNSEEYFRERLTDILFIGFQERLTKDFEIIKSKLGMPENASLSNSDLFAKKAPPGLDKVLTDVAVKNLKNWYKDDFKFIAICEEVSRYIQEKV